jgi:hypothetical protein
MHHLKQQWWQLELHKFRLSCSRFEISLCCLLLNDANSIPLFDQNMRTPGNKLVWLMQFILNNNQSISLIYHIEWNYYHTYKHSTIRIHVPNLWTSLEILVNTGLILWINYSRHAMHPYVKWTQPMIWKSAILKQTTQLMCSLKCTR